MKKLFSIGVVCAAVMAACSPASQEPVKIGYIGPLTGDFSGLGSDTLNTLEMVVEERNAAGGVNGREIVIVPADGRCNGSDAASAAQKIVNVDQVDVIFGGMCSGETLAAAPIIEVGEIVALSPISSSPDVTDAGEYIFRNYPNDALKSTAMAGYFASEEYTKVAIITENTDFGSAFRDAIKAELPEDVVVFDEVVEPGTKDFRTLVTRLKDLDFDVVFPNLQTPANIAAFMQQLREQGLEQPAVSHDVADTAELITIGLEEVDGMRAINVPSVGVGTELEAKFIEKFGDPVMGIPFVSHSYDAVNLLIDALIAADLDEELTVRDYLNDLEVYNGVVGDFSFDENGDVVGISYALKEVKDGEWVTIADISIDQ